MEYHVIGKIEKLEYVITTPIRYSKSGHSYIISKLPCILEEYLKSNYIYRKNTDFCFISNIDELKGISELKANILNIPNFDVLRTFEKYKECFVINSEREFQNGDNITIKNSDYPVKYKYNKELEQHELFIDYNLTDTNRDSTHYEQCFNNYQMISNYVCQANENIYNQMKQLEIENNKTMITKIKDLLFKKTI
jgi:hypothetical protein